MKAGMLIGGVVGLVGGILAVGVMGQVAPVLATAPSTAAAAARPVIAVKTAEELVKALGPDRILELAPGDYKLSEVKRGVGANFKWNEIYANQYEPLIHNAPNLTIRGTGKEPSHIVIADPYATVLSFDMCDSLELVNLKLGHAVEPGLCGGGVVKAANCKGVRLEGCDLYGSGIHGLDLRNIKDFVFQASTIEDCSYGLMQADDCQGLQFEKSTFRQCGEMYGFELKNCTKVELVECTITDNLLVVRDVTLFRTNLSDTELAIHMTGGTIRHNAATALINTPEMLVVEKTVVEGNSWQVAPQLKRARGTRVAQAGGGSIYTTDMNDNSWETLSFTLYGNANQIGKLRAANPLVKEPIWPDTKIICPK